jgi:hypothetical protein
MSFERGALYRMPVHFGPTPGPRQIPAGIRVDHTQSPKRRVASVSYLTRATQLATMLPPRFGLWGEPIVTVEIQFLTEIDWLAGRGYNTAGVKFPVVYRGERETVHGTFLSVLWENLADPIISGREELGYNKIYCEISEPRVLLGRHRYNCAWLGCTFFELELAELREGAISAPAPSTTTEPRSQGTLHYKYVPRTGEPGVADAAYATLTPMENPNLTIESALVGNGVFKFRPVDWHELPTMHHIVNALASLELLEFRGATLTCSRGGKDLSDQRIVI